MDATPTEKIKPLRIFVLTTEQSAEAILKQLLTSIRLFFPDAYIEGVASSEFQFENFVPFINSDSLKVMGLIDVLKSLYRIVKIQSQIKKRIQEGNYDLVLTIDSSSFHIPLVERLKKSGCTARFVHAVCPPIWAYRPGRKPRIAATFDLLLPLFRFEEKLFQDTPLESFWIGHPFAKHEPVVPKPNETGVICIFPGSRKRVIKRNLPLQLAAAKKFSHPIYISISSPQLKGYIESIAPNIPTFEKIPPKEILEKTVLALATSGTITLELALLSIPTVVTYKLPIIDAIAAKLAKMNVPYFSLPNLLANEEVFIELIHPLTTVNEVVEAIDQTLKTEKKIPLEKIWDQIRAKYDEKTFVKKLIENTSFALRELG
ncbi:MAG: hypothetical protein ACOYK9_02300 [Chlamydiia bacterium]